MAGPTQDLLGMAQAMEAEAVRRYARLAALMRSQKVFDVEKVFLDLADMERGHVDRLERLAASVTEQAFGQNLAKPNPDPEAAGDPQATSMLTPYRALSVAVEAEERAFTFYAYAASVATTNAARELAERLAKEELHHAAMLRVKRRRAYRDLDPQMRGSLIPRQTVTERDRASLSLLGAAIEEQAGLGLSELAAELTLKDRSAIDLLAKLAAERRASAAILRAGRSIPAPDSDLAARVLAPLQTEPTAPLFRALQIAEQTFEAYSQIIDNAKSDPVLALFQGLLESAIGQMTLLRAASLA